MTVKNQVIAYLVVQLIMGILNMMSAYLLFAICHFDAKPSLVVPILIVIPVDLAVSIITLVAISGVTLLLLPLAPRAVLWAYFCVCLFSFWQEQRAVMKAEPV